MCTVKKNSSFPRYENVCGSNQKVGRIGGDREDEVMLSRMKC